MISSSLDFITRREGLLKEVKKGCILLSANQVLPRNYAGNALPFRQDSTFLYYTGIDVPDVYLFIDCESGEFHLAGEDPAIEDTIWSGMQSTMAGLAEISGLKSSVNLQELKAKIGDCRKNNRQVRLLPPYTEERTKRLLHLLSVSPDELDKCISPELIRTVVKQRSVKSDAEIAEIESALNVSGLMHRKAMKMAVEGVYEYEIVAELLKIAKSRDLEFAYGIICSVRGEILHNETHRNKLGKGQLLLMDAGVESENHYASDITRTIPVGGKFTGQQKDIYNIVLRAQLEAIKKAGPAVRYYDVHMLAARIIASGLKELGLMKGDVEEAVQSGAHALFFPHGLGHMMGLDVHDMEDLGENYVGYNNEVKRSDQFGTAYLRFARKPEPGFVLTVEPGIYFIPALINQWQATKKFDQFINYSMVGKFINSGGIRIEDNIVITGSGCRVLGDPVLKAPEEIEQYLS
jgi:Xaa-Pro aminopeptidase